MEERAGEAAGRFLKGMFKGLTQTAEKKPIRVSWQKLKNGVLRMSERLSAYHWKPDMLLGVGRSGTVIAGMLAENHRLCAPQTLIATIDRDNPWEIQHSYDKQRVWLENDVTGKRVLVVDIAVHTGGTIKNLVRYLVEDKKVAEVTVYILFGNPEFSDKPLEQYHNSYRGLFYVFTNPEDRRIQFPWYWTKQAQKAHGLLDNVQI